MTYMINSVAVKKLNFDSIKVGDTAEIVHKITQNDVDLFASLTGDFNPLHVNKDYAKTTPFQKPVVHGMLSASFISALIGTRLPGREHFGRLKCWSFCDQHLLAIPSSFDLLSFKNLSPLGRLY